VFDPCGAKSTTIERPCQDRHTPLGELPATTLARLTGHADAGFALRVYARDSRDDAALVEDVLERASAAGIAG